MADEINEPTPQTPTELEPVTQSEPAQIPPENPIPESNPAPVSPQEPTAEAPISPIESIPASVPLEPVETTPSPKDAIPVKDDISANEPLEQQTETAPDFAEATPDKQTSEIPSTPEPKQEQNPTPKTPQNSPETTSQQPTAQMAGNEPLGETQDEQTKQRKENLKLANETRLEKKRKKIDAILNLFAERQTVTNDEVEKFLHVSDATATRYLEILEKENKIKQSGKTGKAVSYSKI